MADNQQLIALLLREMDDAWAMLQQALTGLTAEEFWWCPSENAWTLRNVEGRWILDYDTPKPIPKGPLTVAWLIVHLAACKVMYVEYAFGKGQLTWDELVLPSGLEEALDYLEQSQRPLRMVLEQLTDEELPKLRPTNWGELWPTEKIIWTMIHHDIYHGAQIQTMRKLFKTQYPC